MRSLTAVRFGFAFAIANVLTSPVQAQLSPEAVDARFQPWLGAGGFFSSEESFGEVTVFAPLWQNPNSIFFTQLDGWIYEDDFQEFGAAFGFRSMGLSGWNYGGYLAYDLLSSDGDNAFHRITLGAEALGEVWEGRANVYFPISDSKTRNDAHVFLSGMDIFMTGGRETGLWGVDGEIGGKWRFGGPYSFGAFVGGFLFEDLEDEFDFDSFAGPKARIELAALDFAGIPGAKVAGEADWRWDDVRDHQGKVGVRVSFPLGLAGAAPRVGTTLERLMVERVRRERSLLALSGEEMVEDVATDVRFDRAVTTDAGDDLQTVLDDAGPNSLIIAEGSAGTIAGGVTMNTDQTLMGGGGRILVRGSSTGGTGVFDAPGERPTIQESTIGVIRVADRTHLADFDIRGGGDSSTFVEGNDGVTATGPEEDPDGDDNLLVAFEDLTVGNVGRHGFNFEQSENTWADFRNITVFETARSGVNFEEATGSWVYFGGLDISDTGRAGVNFENSDNVQMYLGNATFERIGTEGIESAAIVLAFSDNANVGLGNVEIRDVSGPGLDFERTEFLIADLKNVTIEDVGLSGMTFERSDNIDVRMRTVMVNNAGREGIDFERSTFSTLAFEDVHVSNVALAGFNMENIDNSSVSLNGVSVTNAGTSGLELGFSSNLIADLTDVRVSNVGTEGIGFEGANDAVINMQNIWVSDVGRDGIQLNADRMTATLSDVIVSGTGQVGINAEGADDSMYSFTNIRIADTGQFDDPVDGRIGIGFDFQGADGTTATFDNVVFSGTFGDNLDDNDALIRSSGAPLPVLNGENLEDDTDNNPPLCRGDFVGELEFDGTTVTNGDICAP